MTYKLAFNESALKEWKKLGHTIQEQFKKKCRLQSDTTQKLITQEMLSFPVKRYDKQAQFFYVTAP